MASYLRINQSIFNEKHWTTSDRNKGILIDSEAFPGVLKYVIKGNSMILLSGCNGVFAFDLACGEPLLNEINAVIDCYRN